MRDWRNCCVSWFCYFIFVHFLSVIWTATQNKVTVNAIQQGQNKRKQCTYSAQANSADSVLHLHIRTIAPDKTHRKNYRPLPQHESFFSRIFPHYGSVSIYIVVIINRKCIHSASKTSLCCTARLARVHLLLIGNFLFVKYLSMSYWRLTKSVRVLCKYSAGFSCTRGRLAKYTHDETRITDLTWLAVIWRNTIVWLWWT